MNLRPSTYHESRPFEAAQPPVAHQNPARGARPALPAEEAAPVSQGVVAGLSSRDLRARSMRKHGNLRLA